MECFGSVGNILESLEWELGVAPRTREVAAEPIRGEGLSSLGRRCGVGIEYPVSHATRVFSTDVYSVEKGGHLVPTFVHKGSRHGEAFLKRGRKALRIVVAPWFARKNPEQMGEIQKVASKYNLEVKVWT